VKIPYETKAHFAHAKGTDQCYFELNLYYHSFGRKKYYYKMNGHFDGGYLMLDSVRMN